MNVLYLVAVGNLDDDILSAAGSCLASVLGFDIETLERWEDPVFAYDEHRGQYSAVAILKKLVERRPAGAIRCVGITDRDLFIPMLSFVFGQAQLQGTAAIVSCARLRQEFYGLPPRTMLFHTRLLKEVLHETGHTFGLTHCSDPACPMSLSTGIRQVDRKGSEFCKGCSALLMERTGRLKLV